MLFKLFLFELKFGGILGTRPIILLTAKSKKLGRTEARSPEHAIFRTDRGSVPTFLLLPLRHTPDFNIEH